MREPGLGKEVGAAPASVPPQGNLTERHSRQAMTLHATFFPDGEAERNDAEREERGAHNQLGVREQFVGGGSLALLADNKARAERTASGLSEWYQAR